MAPQQSFEQSIAALYHVAEPSPVSELLPPAAVG